MNPKKLHRLFFFLLLWIASLLTFGLSFLWIPTASAQLPDVWNIYDNSTKQQPSINYVKRGNIHIANVLLDGVPLFEVAATAANADTGDRHSILPIEWRVNEIENRLENIINSDFYPNTLQVIVKNLNNQAVIIATGKDWEQPLLTLTELDLQIDSTSNSPLEIAKAKAQIIETALLKARKERQPEHLRRQLYFLFTTLLIASAISLIMRQLQKLLKQEWQKINQALIKDTSPCIDANTTEKILSHHSRKTQLPQISLTEQRNLNLTFRFILWWGQIIIWLGISILTLLLFPQTREIGVWLIGVPVSFISILLGLSIAKKIFGILIVYFLNQWADRNALAQSPDTRLVLRIPVINRILQEVISYLIISVGILMFLYAIQVPLTMLLAILGLVGFSTQNLIKDWIGGFLILWEDQYIQDDVVNINGVIGVVEYFNLRITQLRTLDGELVTIANGSFTTAINLTHNWSRLNLRINVAYSTDLDLAMTVIEDVAEKMRRDSVWGEFMMEPPTILGVDGFGDNSITIRLVLKTSPMKQWDLGREYRRRLKQAFDIAGITIPFPQRSIWFENIYKDA